MAKHTEKVCSALNSGSLLIIHRKHFHFVFGCLWNTRWCWPLAFAFQGTRYKDLSTNWDLEYHFTFAPSKITTWTKNVVVVGLTNHAIYEVQQFWLSLLHCLMHPITIFPCSACSACYLHMTLFALDVPTTSLSEVKVCWCAVSILGTQSEHCAAHLQLLWLV